MTFFKNIYHFMESFLRKLAPDWRKDVAGQRVELPIVKPIVLDRIAHDPEAFTQGLLYREGFIYESTGLYGQSSLRKTDLNGNIHLLVPFTEGFGEGLAYLNQELVQLSWREGLAVRCSFPGLERIGTFTYQGEGWGLCSNADRFVMSNGSGTLYIRDSNFKIVDQINVKLKNRSVRYLNDLEYVNGKIYANVWYADFLLEIDYRTGNVLRIIDCSDLVAMENPPSRENILNGIAYCQDHDVFYITGKKWRHIFIVKIP